MISSPLRTSVDRRYTTESLSPVKLEHQGNGCVRKYEDPLSLFLSDLRMSRERHGIRPMLCVVKVRVKAGVLVSIKGGLESSRPIILPSLYSSLTACVL